MILVSGLWNQEARGASPLGVLRASSPGACVGRTSPVAKHPASCILHPASGWLGWAGLGWAGLGWLAGLGWWLAGGWLVVGWWLVGGWLVVGWWLAGTRHRNATLGECSFAAGCWLLVAGCWLLVAWRRKVARNATILLRAGSVYKTTFRPTTRLLVVRKKAYTKHLFDTFLKNIFGVNTL